MEAPSIYQTGQAMTLTFDFGIEPNTFAAPIPAVSSVDVTSSLYDSMSRMVHPSCSIMYEEGGTFTALIPAVKEAGKYMLQVTLAINKDIIRTFPVMIVVVDSTAVENAGDMNLDVESSLHDIERAVSKAIRDMRRQGKGDQADTVMDSARIKTGKSLAREV